MGNIFQISCRLHSRRPLLWLLENAFINDLNIWGWQFNNRVSSIHLNGCVYQPSECGWVSSQLLHIATPWGQFLGSQHTFHFNHLTTIQGVLHCIVYIAMETAPSCSHHGNWISKFLVFFAWNDVHVAHTEVACQNIQVPYATLVVILQKWTWQATWKPL